MRHTETKSAPEGNGDVRVQTICACLVRQMDTSVENVFRRLRNGRVVPALATLRNKLERKRKTEKEKRREKKEKRKKRQSTRTLFVLTLTESYTSNVFLVFFILLIYSLLVR